MKKYLMTGIAAVAMCAAFTSCSKDANFEQMKSEQILANYDDAFIAAFGQPAANQDWGFGSRQLPASFGTVTRNAYPNGNLWESEGYNVPADISTDEYNAVMRVFNTVGEASYESLVDWDCFFVQQVHKGTAKYYPRNQYVDCDYNKGLNSGAQQIVGSDHMDWLCTVAEQKLVTTCWWPLEQEVQACDPYDDHIFDFNNSNSNDYGGRMLMLNSNTNVFGYYNSEDSKVHYEFRMEYIAPYGYFVGFDFYGNGGNPNQDIERDYIYNDWIVKIVPGKGVTPPTPPERYTVRIICEDLMANSGSDFDFNDVVFDASYTEGSNITTVTLQCAGGTLPLFVAGHEVHDEFARKNPNSGITTTTMINTNATVGEHVDGLAPVSFEIDHIVAPWDIEVAVMVSNNIIPLKADANNPTAKIAVDPDFVWCNERDDITDVYTNFSDYVQNTNVNWY